MMHNEDNKKHKHYNLHRRKAIMVKLYEGGAYLVNGTDLVPEAEAARVAALTGKGADKEEDRKSVV